MSMEKFVRMRKERIRKFGKWLERKFKFKHCCGVSLRYIEEYEKEDKS